MATAEFMMGSRRTYQGHSASETRASVLPDLAVRREQQVVCCVRAVHRQARHYEFDVDRHVVHTDQEKIKSTGNINIFSRHGRKLFPRPSIMSAYEKSNQKSRIIRSAPPKE
jgi:hypothetical protein